MSGVKDVLEDFEGVIACGAVFTPLQGGAPDAATLERRFVKPIH